MRYASPSADSVKLSNSELSKCALMSSSSFLSFFFIIFFLSLSFLKLNQSNGRRPREAEKSHR